MFAEYSFELWWRNFSTLSQLVGLDHKEKNNDQFQRGLKNQNLILGNSDIKIIVELRSDSLTHSEGVTAAQSEPRKAIKTGNVAQAGEQLDLLFVP